MTVCSSGQANGGLNKWGATCLAHTELVTMVDFHICKCPRTLLRSKQYHILSSVGGHEAQCKRCKCVIFLIKYVTKAM